MKLLKYIKKNTLPAFEDITDLPDHCVRSKPLGERDGQRFSDYRE